MSILLWIIIAIGGLFLLGVILLILLSLVGFVSTGVSPRLPLLLLGK